MFEDLKFPFSLGSDNHAAVHPKVMRAIIDANRGSAHAYGGDEVSERLRVEVARLFGPEAETHLVFNGTAANVLCLSLADPGPPAVIAAETAHLHLDEGGAPESFLGAKIYPLASTDGRIQPAAAARYLGRRGDQHFASPRVISLTQPTELGVCYTLDELDRWREFCRAEGLYLHIDGARLANAAVHLGCDLGQLTRGADLVSFGGTKNGLLGAEAVIILNPALRSGARARRKRAMQLPSKTRFLAAQMFAYLEGDLWRDVAEHVVTAAKSLAARLPPEARLAFPVESNALFVDLPEAWLAPLRERAFFYIWDRAIARARWMLGWDFTEAHADQLIAHLDRLAR